MARTSVPCLSKYRRWRSNFRQADSLNF